MALRAFATPSLAEGMKGDFSKWLESRVSSQLSSRLTDLRNLSQSKGSPLVCTMA